MDWNKVLSRLSIPGLTLLILGGLTCLRGPRLCSLVWGERAQKWSIPVSVLGLTFAILGALILLDVIPGF